MILIYPNLYKAYLIPLGYLHTYFPKLSVHLIRKNYSSILRRTHQVIEQYRYIVPLMYVLTHTSLYLILKTAKQASRN